MDALGAREPLLGNVDAIEYPLGENQGVAFLVESQSAVAVGAYAVRGSWRDRVCAVAASYMRPFVALTLAAGGPGTTEADVRNVYDDFRAVGRSFVSEIAYAYIAVDPSFGTAENRSGGGFAWAVEGGGRPNPETFDRWVPDAFPWQILSPGHLTRLGEMPAGAQRLDAAKVELSIGALEDWSISDLPPELDMMTWHVKAWADVTARRRDPTIQHTARDLIRPLLPNPEEAMTGWRLDGSG